MAKKKSKARKSFASQISVFSVMLGFLLALLVLALIYLKHNMQEASNSYSQTTSPIGQEAY